jgi:pyruvate-formate lyase-activating enzyme
MHEVAVPYPQKIDGISILVGTASCDACCPGCAGIQHRQNAPRHDGEIDIPRLREVLSLCWERDCRYVTLTGSGEPTLSPLSVTKALEVIHEYAEGGKIFDPVNLYTNGIRTGTDEEFCDTYFPLWKTLGLTRIYISVFSVDEALNAEAFRVKGYPPFEVIFERIKRHGLILRTSVVLKRGFTDTLEKFEYLCEKFFAMGVDSVTAWPLKDDHDFISELAPERFVLEAISNFGKTQGGRIRVLLGDSNSPNNLGQKIALFQDGQISDVWCARR